VLSIISILTSSSWTHARWAQPLKQAATESSENPEDNIANVRGLIEDGAGEGEYHDSIEERSRVTEGPRVQPSQLVDHSNEWREEGEGQRA
jgi:hypothetical protein